MPDVKHLKRMAQKIKSRLTGNSYRFSTASRRTISLPLRGPKPQPGKPAQFFFGMYKGGSTLLHRTVRDILKEHGMAGLDVPGNAFQAGYTMDELAIDTDNVFEIPGIPYVGFRHLPLILFRSQNFMNSRKLLLIRDPRDALVSLYYSLAYSHKMPEAGRLAAVRTELRTKVQGSDIDEFVLHQSRNLSQHFLRYISLIGFVPAAKVLRYEDIIFEKMKLVDGILETLDLTLPTEAKQRVIKKNDIVPTTEDIHSHIRNVTPGDHRKKLKKETIQKLDEIFAPVYAVFWPEGVDPQRKAAQIAMPTN